MLFRTNYKCWKTKKSIRARKTWTISYVLSKSMIHLKDPFVLLLWEITNVRTFTTSLAQYHITPKENKNQILWNKGIKCLKIFKAALKTQITISISTSVKSFFKDSWHLNFLFLFLKNIPYQLLSIQLKMMQWFL